MPAAESHLLPVYGPPEQVFVRGEGCWIWDDKGERYLDCIAGIAVDALGHAPPVLVKALTEQAGRLWHISNMFKIKGQEELAAKYCAHSFADVVFFTNSGTEAIEGSLKTVRKFHTANGNPERVDIIGFQGSFHGRSYAAINASGNPGYLEGFGPKLPGYLQAPFGDIEAVKKLVGPTTAGIIIEPVQGEGGVRAAPEGFLKALRKLADDNGFLIIFDEVQSGAGRTGKLWAHEWDGATPDVMAVAKGVGGGFPMGAFLATREAAKGMVKGVHGTTFGGNPLAMAVGNACFDELSQPKLLEHVNVVANYLGQALEGVKDRHPNLVVETRGRGLLRGLKLKIDPKPLQAKLRDRRVLVGVAGDNVLRMAPPLIIDEAQISQAVDAIDAVFAEQMAEAGA
ncbi:MAG: aspartate aminotransferase family protein [Vitreimonas sp.]